MNKISIIVLSAVVLIGAGAISADAYKGDPSKIGPNCTEEQHAAVTKAIVAGDFATWKSEMAGKGRVSQVITAENFPKFRQAHMLAQQGKLEEAAKIRAELGLGLKDGKGGKMMGRGNHFAK